MKYRKSQILGRQTDRLTDWNIMTLVNSGNSSNYVSLSIYSLLLITSLQTWFLEDRAGETHDGLYLHSSTPEHLVRWR